MPLAQGKAIPGGSGSRFSDRRWRNLLGRLGLQCLKVSLFSEEDTKLVTTARVVADVGKEEA